MECVVQKILLHNELRNPIFRRNEELGETKQSSKFGSVLGAQPETAHEDGPSSGSRKILGCEGCAKNAKKEEMVKLQHADTATRRKKWDAF